MKRVVAASKNNKSLKDLSKKAEDIADNLSEFLDATSRISNLNDYLDEYDIEHLGKAMDALYDVAMMFANDRG